MSDTFTPAFGWINDPAAVAATLPQIAAIQGAPPDYRVLCADLDAQADDDADVVFWRAEEKLFGSIKPSWDQGGVGTCVSFGWGRGINDLICLMAAEGLIDWPGADVATEPIYAGSRVEVGGGRIGGDGSVGAWAAKWAAQWGTLLRLVYEAGGQTYDLTSYSESRSRDWGRRGCPDALEPIARLFPVGSVVLVENAAQAWKLLGNRNPIPICSGVGFDSPLTEGFCEPRGSWPHCVLPETIIAGKEFKRADQVRVGDEVYGRDGRLHRVSEVFTRKFSGELVRIKPQCGESLTVTDEHPVLVYRRVRKGAAVLQSAGVVERAEGIPQDARARSWESHQPVWVCAKDVRPGDYLATPGLIADDPPVPAWPDRSRAVKKPSQMQLSDEVAYLLGFFIGDGNATENHRVCLTLALKDDAERLSAAFRELGFEPRVTEYPTFRRLVVDSVVAAEAFVEWFGHGSSAKHIPDWLLRSSKLPAVIEGILDSDGCRYKGMCKVTTTSRVLALQLRHALAGMGHRPACRPTVRGPGAFANASPAWDIEWRPSPARGHVRRAGHLNLYLVKSCLLIPHDGVVFNYEVEGTHDYVADGYVTHNCMVIRGRVMARRGGTLVKGYACQNSWGNYLSRRGTPTYVDRDGNQRPLPPGCFLMDEQAMDRILRERDSFAIADQRGFKPKPRDLDWLI